MFKVFSLLVVWILLVSHTPLYGADGDAILGLWNTLDRDAQFEIYPCGSMYCGKMVWLQEPDFPAEDPGGMAGLPKVDRNNPDPGLRTRPFLGLRILEGFSYSGDHQWENGRVYNPENGKFYRAKITLESDRRLKLRGFVGISLLGRTETWTR